jgi:hypothetical protein
VAAGASKGHQANRKTSLRIDVILFLIRDEPAESLPFSATGR